MSRIDSHLVAQQMLAVAKAKGLARAAAKKKELWEEYIVQVVNPDFNLPVPICGLCGNTGVVDTRETAIVFGNTCGVKQACICPNGDHFRNLK